MVWSRYRGGSGGACFFSSRRRHTRFDCDWSSDVCSSDLLLTEYARAHKTTIKEAVRQAIRRLAIRDEVDSKDPIFVAFPVARKKGRHSDASERVDFYLYGWEKA